MHIVIFISVSGKKEARKITSILIRRKLAACVNIVEKLESVFWWKGKIDCAKESLLIIKSKKSSLPRIIRAIKLAHSYDLPEIIALPIVGGFKPYLKWIDDSVSG